MIYQPIFLITCLQMGSFRILIAWEFKIQTMKMLKMLIAWSTFGYWAGLRLVLGPQINARNAALKLIRLAAQIAKLRTSNKQE